MQIDSRADRGSALLGSLLLLLLVSGLAATLVYMVNSEKNIGGSDVEKNSAYYGAEAGMEKMMADLGELYASRQAPSTAEIRALGNSAPNLPNIGYPEYVVDVADAGGMPATASRNITSGPNAGLNAQIAAMHLQVTAQRPLQQQVRMIRDIEVALIPVFQFGVFSDTDLSYFNGPSFDFAGRVHTNGNLFLATQDGLTFHDKVTAAKDVIRTQLANGVDTGANGYTGAVMLPTAARGCEGAPPPKCRNLAIDEGSVVSGAGSAVNSKWASLSTSTYNGMILNGATGAKPLTLPFVSDGVPPIEIIKRPGAGEDPRSVLGQSRMYNLAQIRVLLSDTPDALPGGSTDADNVRLDGAVTMGARTSYFGRGKTSKDPNWIEPPGTAAGSDWPLIDGYLRVEVQNADKTTTAVTREWLGLGFARGTQVPDSEHGSNNPVHNGAILLFQMLADGLSVKNSNIYGTGTHYNWYPINLYDAREGETIDVDRGAADTTCAVGGIINIVELDVGNLRTWLAGTANGQKVDNATQNGYVLYFSDQRGATGDIGAGFGVGSIVPGDPKDAAMMIGNCKNNGRKNRVTGWRHALKLVNGSLGILPTKPDNTGGFTVASENPVYITGNYNANDAGYGTSHAAAAVIADAVTLLSRNWSDQTSLLYPTHRGYRPAQTSWYRVAVAAGKNGSFAHPAGTANDYGTDGGVHNFLRYLEDWSGQTLNYTGSLVSFYLSQYSVGVYKCCKAVYNAPNRKYAFDTDFLDPSKMPPGTPHFRDVVNVGFHQDMRPY